MEIKWWRWPDPSPTHWLPLEETCSPLQKRKNTSQHFVAGTKYAFQSPHKFWPSLFSFLIFRLLGFYCSQSIYRCNKNKYERQWICPMWKKKASASFKYIQGFYFCLDFYVWKIKYISVRTTIILSRSNIKTVKAINKGLCLWSKVRMKTVTRIIQGFLISIFLHFLPVSGNWQFGQNDTFRDSRFTCSQKDIWVQVWMWFFWHYALK